MLQMITPYLGNLFSGGFWGGLQGFTQALGKNSLKMSNPSREESSQRGLQTRIFVFRHLTSP